MDSLRGFPESPSVREDQTRTAFDHGKLAISGWTEQYFIDPERFMPSAMGLASSCLYCDTHCIMTLSLETCKRQHVTF